MASGKFKHPHTADDELSQAALIRMRLQIAAQIGKPGTRIRCQAMLACPALPHTRFATAGMHLEQTVCRTLTQQLETMAMHHNRHMHGFTSTLKCIYKNKYSPISVFRNFQHAQIPKNKSHETAITTSQSSYTQQQGIPGYSHPRLLLASKQTIHGEINTTSRIHEYKPAQRRIFARQHAYNAVKPLPSRPLYKQTSAMKCNMAMRQRQSHLHSCPAAKKQENVIPSA